nr:GxxExxY protein [Rhodopila globiformis]
MRRTAQAGIPFQREAGVPVMYKARSLTPGFRAGILVVDTVLVAVKAVAALLPAHNARVPIYPRVSPIREGLPMNCHATRLKDGLRRFIA